MQPLTTAKFLVTASILCMSTAPALAVKNKPVGPPKGVAWVKVDGGYQANVNWCVVAGGTEQTCQFKPGLQVLRITEKDQITVEISNFNHLRYRLKIETDEVAIESYQYLEKLWSQILGFNLSLSGASSAAPRTGFDAKATAWLKEMLAARVTVKGHLDQHTKVGLTPTEVGNITTASASVEEHKSALNLLRNEALSEANSLAEIKKFEEIAKRHDEIMSALDAFTSSAKLVVRGQRKVIGRKKPGVEVTVQATPTAENEPVKSAKTLRLTYFVHSRHPLAFHVGYAHSELEEIEFEKVRALDGRDLFAQLKKDEGTDEFTAFLSYELRTWGKRGDYGVLATLGTDLNEVGDRVYAGVSAKVARRWFVTVGMASSQVSEGQGMVMEMDSGGMPTGRELFETFNDDREWEVFYGVSFGVK